MTPRTLFRRGTTPPHILTLVLLTGLSALSMNVFLPSLPGMTAYFQTDYQTMQLSVGLYLAVSAVLQILIGPMSDKLGRRPVILWGIVLYLLATIGCLLSQNVVIFLIFRMAQATIAVGMVLGRAAVRDMYPADKAASMLGYVAMGMAVVPMLGPPIGGALDQLFGWQSNFILLIVAALLLLLLVWRDFGETAHVSGKTLLEQFREYPELFRSPRFWGYTLTATSASGTFFVFLGGAPFVGSEVFGLSAARLGIFFGAPAVGYFTGNFLSGRFSSQVGLNGMAFWGSMVNFVAVLAGLLLFALGFVHWAVFFSYMVFVGLGNGMTIPNATSGCLSVRPHLAGTASGLSGSVMLATGAGLSALAGAILTPGSGPVPMLALQAVIGALGVVAMVIVLHRTRQIGS